MMSKISRRLTHTSLQSALFLFAILLVSCGSTALPKPTQQAITPKQLVGRWSYRGDYNQTTVVIEFLTNGRFRQTVTLANGAIKKQQGTWKLQGANVELSNILLNESSKSTPTLITWKPGSSVWWFTDEAGKLQLMGGEHRDPDDARELKRQAPIP